MKNLLSFFFLCIFFSCSTDSKNDFVDIEIPEGLTNKDAIASLKKDEKQLNRVFNSIQDGMLAFEEMVLVVTEMDENTSRKELEREIGKAYAKLGWSMTKATFNGLYFLTREELEKKNTQDLINMLSNEEALVFEKSVKHIQIKKEELEIEFNAYSKRLDSLMTVLKSKEEMMERWKENQ